MARFVLGEPRSAAKAMQDAATLAVDFVHPVARQVAGGSHGGLLTLERTATSAA